MLAQLLHAYDLAGNWVYRLTRRKPELARLPVVRLGPCSVTYDLGGGERLAFFGIRPRRETLKQRALRLALQMQPFGASPLVLQPAAAAGVDTSISSNAAEQAYNFGAHTLLYIGDYIDNYHYRGLIKFDLTDLPAEATVSSTTLALYCTADYATNASTYLIYRLKRAWVEGTRAAANDNPATGATWVRYDTTSNWATAGGFGSDDCEQTSVGSRSMSATETTDEFKNFSLTPTSKAALDLGNGWLIKADTESRNHYRFASSDNTTAANRPTLTIAYSEGTSGKPFYAYAQQ